MGLGQNRDIDPWNKIESQEMDPHRCDELIFYKSTKEIQWEMIDFSIGGVGTCWHLYEKRNKPWFISYTVNKNYTKMGHTSKPKTSRIKQEKIFVTLGYMKRTQRAFTIKEKKLTKWTSSKIKTSVLWKILSG